VQALAERAMARSRIDAVMRVPGLVDAMAATVYDFTPWTPLANATGAPSMSVPLYWSAEGLPVGAMFTARFGDDATLFRLAAQLETARPWATRRPPVHAFD
jgi:amidase